MPNSEIFIFYAWGGESEEIANALESAFQEEGIRVVRDKTDLGYKGLVREFMQQIGQGKCVVTVISDKYLKSKNCLFELLEIASNSDFYDRIFPIVLRDAQIYNPVERLNYINYWDGKRKELNEAIKEVDEIVNLEGITEEINLYAAIRSKFAEITNLLQNMNSLTVKMHREADFGQIIAAIQKKLHEDEIRYNLPNSGVFKVVEDDEALTKINPSADVSPSLQTSSNTTPGANINLNLNYGSRSLSSLKSKFYDLLIKIDEQNQPVIITAEDIEEWLKDLELAENQIQEVRKNIAKKEDSNS